MLTRTTISPRVSCEWEVFRSLGRRWLRRSRDGMAIPPYREMGHMKKLTPSMVVALLALFVALSGTAVASGLMSGSQIKDHTIAASKLTPNAVKFLHGQQGLQGQQGQQGTTGPTGQTGPTGTAGTFGSATIQVVSTGSQTFSGVGTIHATCPSGTRVIGGGAAAVGTLFIDGYDGANGWEAGAIEISPGTGQINAVAICAS